MRTLISSAVLLSLSCQWLACAASELLPVRAIAFSTDGKLVAVGSGARETGGSVCIWSIELGPILTTNLLKHMPQERGVSSLAFSPDGKQLAMALYDQSPTLLRIESFDVEKQFEANCRGPVAFTPIGATFACGCEDRTIRLFDLDMGREQSSLAGHTDRLYTLGYSPDGKRLVSVARDGIRLWDLATRQTTHRLSHGQSLTSCGIFLTADWVLTGGWDGSAKLWNAESGQLRGRFHGMGGVDRLAYCKSNGLLAICTSGRQVPLFNAKLDAPTTTQTQQIAALLSSLNDDDIAVRERVSQELVQLGFHAESVLKESAEEATAAETRIRSRLARKALYSEPQAKLDHPVRPWCVAFSPDGKILITGGDDGIARIWETTGSKKLADLLPPKP